MELWGLLSLFHQDVLREFHVRFQFLLTAYQIANDNMPENRYRYLQSAAFICRDAEFTSNKERQ
jgi:hypothetical protein